MERKYKIGDMLNNKKVIGYDHTKHTNILECIYCKKKTFKQSNNLKETVCTCTRKKRDKKRKKHFIGQIYSGRELFKIDGEGAKTYYFRCLTCGLVSTGSPTQIQNSLGCRNCFWEKRFMKRDVLVGKRFGRLVVDKREGKYIFVKCECGNIKKWKAHKFITRKVNSYGCENCKGSGRFELGRYGIKSILQDVN